MSNIPDGKDVEPDEKKINDLNPSELKARLYAITSGVDAEILQKAADVLYKEDITGTLFLQMKREDFKEIGLTFGCRNVLVKYREELLVASPIVHPFAVNGLVDGAKRISRGEGQVRGLFRQGENTEEAWDCPTELPPESPELPPISEITTMTGEISEYRSGSSIFAIPVGPPSHEKSCNSTMVYGEITVFTEDGDEKLANMEETIRTETIRTEELFASVNEYLNLSPSDTSNDKKWGFDRDEKIEAKSSPPIACSPSVIACDELPGIHHFRSEPNFRSEPIRVKYKLPENNRAQSYLSPKAKSLLLEAESFVYLGGKELCEKTTLDNLRKQHKILKEGWYDKAHGHREKWKKLGWDARYGVLLNNGMLVYFAAVGLTNKKASRITYKRTVDLSALQMVNIQPGTGDWRIKIHTPKSSPPTHLLRFETEKEMNEWRDALLEVGGLRPPRGLENGSIGDANDFLLLE